MRVALDAQLALGTATGIGEYVSGLAQALRSLETDVVELCEPRLDPWRFDRRVAWDQLLLPLRAAASGADVLHCASGTMPLRARQPIAVTVHDIAWLKVQRHTRSYARWYFGRFSLSRYKAAHAIAVDSSFSRDELLDLTGIDQERVHVVYPGVADEYCTLSRRPALDQFVLVPGTVEPRKNLEVLVRALAHVPRARIVSVGPFTAYRDTCLRLAAQLGVDTRLECRGYVTRLEYVRLYETCAAVAVPSKYEGFGYPAAQALCAGVPLVAARSSSLPEIAADAASLDPDDDRGWAQAMIAILEDPAAAQARAEQRRSEAIARFSWPAAAGRMLHVYRRALVNG